MLKYFFYLISRARFAVSKINKQLVNNLKFKIMNTLNVKKMNNYSITEQKESENLVFFFGVCITNNKEDKNGRYFMYFDEADEYFESLEIEDGFYKRFDEYFINQEENTIGNYGNVRFDGDLELINRLDNMNMHKLDMNAIEKQDLIEVVSIGNILTTAIDKILHNLFEHKLYVYKNEVYFYANGNEVNPNDYNGVYNLYVEEIQNLIEIIETTDYPFSTNEKQAILFFRNII